MRARTLPEAAVERRRVLSEERLALGLDIGGTKLAAALVDARGLVRHFASSPTPTGSGDAIAERAIALCRQVLADWGGATDGVVGAGIGCPGPIDIASGLMLHAPNLPGVRDWPITALVASGLGIQATLDNDATAAALGEARFGAGVGVPDLLYLTVSTGIGGGIVSGGRVVRGGRGNAAEVGHIVVAPGGRLCGCGHRGCLEAHASGTALARAWEERSGAPSGSRTAEQLAAAVRAGDPLARAVWDEGLAWLAQGIANLAHVLDPERVIIGGGVARAEDIFFEPLARLVRPLLMDAFVDRFDIVPAALGAKAGVIGAAAVAFDVFGDA